MQPEPDRESVFGHQYFVFFVSWALFWVLKKRLQARVPLPTNECALT